MRSIVLVGCVTGALLVSCGVIDQMRSSSKPAPLGAIGFDAGSTLPEGFRADATNLEGKLAAWTVVADEKAPSSPNVLKLAQPDREHEGTFNLCWSDRIKFKDGSIFVRFRADEGVEDQGGGVIWRAKDNKNYYVCRMNPLEHNFRLYWVKDGRRKQIAGADVNAKAGEWHTIEVKHEGSHIECSLDGVKHLEAADSTFPEAGGVGLWTKADAATSFDDFAVTQALTENDVKQLQALGYVGGSSK